MHFKRLIVKNTSEQSFVMAIIILLMTKGDKTTEFSAIRTFTQLTQCPACGAELCAAPHGCTAPLLQGYTPGITSQLQNKYRNSCPAKSAPPAPPWDKQAPSHSSRLGAGSKGEGHPCPPGSQDTEEMSFLTKLWLLQANFLLKTANTVLSTK